MATLHQVPVPRQRVTTQSPSQLDADQAAAAPLIYRERCRVALGSLSILERRCQMRLAQIKAERQALLESLQSARAMR
jgi:hypothetical protein